MQALDASRPSDRIQFLSCVSTTALTYFLITRSLFDRPLTLDSRLRYLEPTALY
jgi:hypothetical protein